MAYTENQEVLNETLYRTVRNQLEAERIHPSQGRDEFNNTTNEITDEFLQQVIHIGSRKEFDSYMKNIENSYYS